VGETDSKFKIQYSRGDGGGGEPRPALAGLRPICQAKGSV
jgi:hypothetical protein